MSDDFLVGIGDALSRQFDRRRCRIPASSVCLSADFFRFPLCATGTVSIPPPKIAYVSSNRSIAEFSSATTASASSEKATNSTLIF
jgi:hypothetical protein